MDKRIVCAANQSDIDGTLVLGVRHFDDFIRASIKALGRDHKQFYRNQGFIDQLGNYHTREEAHKIASANGQIIRRCGGDESTLYSENLY